MKLVAFLALCCSMALLGCSEAKGGVYEAEFGTLTYEITGKGERAHLSIAFRGHGAEERLDYYRGGVLERTELALPEGHYLYEPLVSIGAAALRDPSRGGLAPRFDPADALDLEEASIGPTVDVGGTICESYAFKDGTGLDVERAGHGGILYYERATRYGEEVSLTAMRSADFSVPPSDDLFSLPKGISIKDERSGKK
jgi:hypothetical protein